jgi:hypothetical protein
MSTTEFLAFIPLLIYGLGLTILLGEWKRIIDRNEIFLPYTLMTLFLTEIMVYNVFIYERLIEHLAGLSYLHYLVFLISPILFYLTVLVFTPDPGDKTKDHFIERMPLFYVLIALLTATNFFYRLEESIYVSISRIIFIIVVVICGFTRKIWLTYVLIIMWLITLIFRGTIISRGI